MGELVVSPIIFKEFCPTKNLHYLTTLNVGFTIGGVIMSIFIVLVELLNNGNIPNFRVLAAIIFLYQIFNCFVKMNMKETPGILIVKEKYEKLMKF